MSNTVQPGNNGYSQTALSLASGAVQGAQTVINPYPDWLKKAFENPFAGDKR